MSSDNMDRKFQEFEHALAKNTQELIEDVKKERQIEAEIPELKAKLRADESELNRLKPKIHELENEKRKMQMDLQRVTETNRTKVNEHLSDPHKMIKPSINLHDHRN